MSVKTYNKLVRDNIPAIIEASGAVCETEILNTADYLRMLDEKLGEELAEYRRDQNAEELADLLEVIYACAAARGYSEAELNAIRAEKANQRGGFSARILLKSVTEED
jgi:predicted house-cleaning noncanonical NTP pyrophosphatase (MazG superfamily)